MPDQRSTYHSSDPGRSRSLSLRHLLDLFNRAVEFGPRERSRFLDQACARQPTLRHELDALLASYDRLPSGFLDTLSSMSADAPGSALPALAPGTAIGPYELIEEIGRGGMSRVYKARHTRLVRRVAIKFMDRVTARLSERFLLEARATARCSHENIVVIHDVDEYRDTPFLVLEYLEGESLADLLGRERRLSPGRAVQLIIPVLRALACAHRQHIIHRDLKPENIVITRAGTVKVVDFGIAKFLRESAPGHLTQIDLTRVTSPENVHANAHATIDMTVPELAQPTRAGAVMGTLAYMAPEQWDSGLADHRTDLWAVGILLYRMVTGQHPLAPLSGMDLAVTRILAQPMPDVRRARPDLPEPLARVIDRCLQKSLPARAASAEQLIDELGTMLPGRQRQESTEHLRSPYAGLAAFDESDAGRFFGRNRDISALMAMLRDQPLVGVVGPSGVGKSSLVRAGLIPALQYSGETWTGLVIRPGGAPMARLAQVIAQLISPDAADSDLDGQLDIIRRRLAHEPGYLGWVLRRLAHKQKIRVLVFVDQFEELYTLTRDDRRERLAFTTCLAGAADDATSPVRVVLSVRSDFLDRVAENRSFMTELHRGLYFLTAPDRAGLRDALVKPAELLGHRFESTRMVEDMLDALEARDAALPLLQFAATKLWEARDRRNRLLTQTSYAAIGGIDGALASHADAVLASLPPREQTLVRTIFINLVTPERTRILAQVDELCELSREPGVIERLLDHLVQARLLVGQTDESSAGALIEIVHESLIHSWPQLDHWLDQHHEDLVFLDQLRPVARRWDATGRPRGLLWRGEAMEEARRWMRRYRGQLTGLHEQYLSAVFSLAERASRRKRLAIVGTMVFLVLLVIAGSVALVTIRAAEMTARHRYTDLQESIRERERLAEQKSQIAGDLVLSQRALQDKNQALETQNQALEESRSAALTAMKKAERESARAQASEKRAQSALDELERAHATLASMLKREENQRIEAQRLAAERERELRELKIKLPPRLRGELNNRKRGD